MPHLLTLLLALLCAWPAAAMPADAETRPGITVTGSGSVTAVPDRATITTGVETTAPTPAEALAQNSAAAQAVVAALGAHGVAQRDIQTSGFHLSPQYVHPRDGIGEPTVQGYTVSNQLTIVVRELDRLGMLLDALVAAGSNRLSGLQFGHANLPELTDQARRAAVQEARRRASLYADAAGVRLGEVISITELGGGMPPQPMYRMAMDMAAAPPIEAGEQQVEVSVQVSWALASPD